MKRTEGGPQVESKDFRYGVNGFPKAGGLYRRGDNGAIPPDRFYRAWNVQFNGDELTERGGQSDFSTASDKAVTGLFSSNNSWEDYPGFVGTTGTGEEEKLLWKTNTFSPISGIGPSSWTGDILPIDAPNRETYSTKGMGDWGVGLGGLESVITNSTIWSSCHHAGRVFFSVSNGGGSGTFTVQKIVHCAPVDTTGTNTYNADGVFTDITDAGLTYVGNNSAPGTATTVNIGAYLFSYGGDLYALYYRYNSASRGLLRKWSGSGTTWSTVGTFPALTARIGGGNDYRGFTTLGNCSWTVELDGAIYLPIVGIVGSAADAPSINALSILKFDGTNITEFYNYAIPLAKRATFVYPDFTSTGAAYCTADAGLTGANYPQELGSYTLIPPISSPFKIGGNMFFPFSVVWSVDVANPGNSYVYGRYCLVLNSSGYVGDNITTTSLIAVQDWTFPTGVPATASDFPATIYGAFPPYALAVNVAGVLYGVGVNHTQFGGSDGLVYLYRSLDGFAWYRIAATAETLSPLSTRPLTKLTSLVV